MSNPRLNRLGTVVLVGVVALLVAAVPAVASVHQKTDRHDSARAASGWVLPAAASTHGNQVTTSFGTHCGSSRFGVYKMRGGLTDRGRQSAWTFFVKLTANGKLHRASKLRFTKYTPASVQKKVRSILKQTRFHYLSSAGREYIQGVWHGGKQQELQSFNPVRGNCR